MTQSEIEKLITRYLIDEASSEDLDFLSLWITNPENEEKFRAYVKVHYEVTLAMNSPDIDAIKRNLFKQIKKDKSPFKNFRAITIVKYAAVLVLFFGLGYLLYESTSALGIGAEDHYIESTRGGEITIELANGQVEILDEHGSRELVDATGVVIGTQNKGSLKYDSITAIEENLMYNTLNVPYGKRFDVQLSDGSRVYLNSGTSLRYPTKFLKGQPRNVFLVGEAYFDVAEDMDRPFVVNADQMNIRVLGTKFNVTHYQENESINTVLVEGSVELFNDTLEPETKTVLKPGYKATWDKTKQDITLDNVDTRIYTAWLEGKLIFRNATFKQIRHSLERHYNVKINSENPVLDEQRFDATFDIETINQVLETFSKSYAIDYEVVDNEILIK